MARLLDDIKKAILAEDAIDEKFVSDNGHSEVPDVKYDKSAPKVKLGRKASDDDTAVEVDDDEDNMPKSKKKKEVEVDDEDMPIKEVRSRLRAKLAADDEEDDMEVKAGKKGDNPTSFKNDKDEVPKLKKAKKAGDNHVENPTPYKNNKDEVPKLGKKSDDMCDDDDEELSEEQKNRDEPGHKSMANKKIEKNADNYHDDEEHITEEENCDDDEDMPKAKKKRSSENDPDDPDYQEWASKNRKSKKAGDGDDDEDDMQDMIKAKKLKKEDFSVSEDLAAIFSGTKLSESFIKKATSIYEASIVSRANDVVALYVEDLAEDYKKAKARLEESMVDKIDAYLDKVISEWMEENKPAVESSLRVQVTESFMEGLKALFEAHYIEVPKSKEKIVESLITETADLQAKLDEEINKNIKLRQRIQEVKRESLLESASADLSANQADKLRSLSEGVDYESAESFAEKLTELKEAYFKPRRGARTIEDSDTPIELREDVTIDRRADEAKTVASAIGRMLRK